MKNKIISIIIFLILLFSISCSTDVDINGEYQDVPVIFCVLDPSQEYQYVKVNKLFLGEASAIEIAKISDSLFYDNVSVSMTQMNGNTVAGTWQFEAVNMPKDDGIFASDKNIVYRSKIPFNNVGENTKFKLDVNVENGKYLASGEATLLDKPRITKPYNNPMSLAILENAYEYKYMSVRGGCVYQMIMNFNYLEVQGSDTVYKSIEWRMPQNISKSVNSVDEIKGSFSNEAFFSLLLSKIKPAEGNMERLVKMPESMTFRVICANEDYYTYMQVSSPSSGVAQHKPEFSNIDGGYGLMASRSSSDISYGKFNARTLSLLNMEDDYKQLGFAPTTHEYYKPHISF
jgi:hypothetical protein